MHDIRFRAWDTMRRKMYSADEMGKDELQINPDGRGFMDADPKDTRLTKYFTHMIPLQYTGLKDKNGKEIYEGDIVRDFEGVGVVGYAAPGFQVKVNDTYWALGGGSCYPDNAQLQYTEVIGNIYENGDLLADK